MSADDKARWSETYATLPAPEEPEPAQFLAENISLLTPGRTLDVAAGRGRNAIFLAAHGHRVLAVDLSRSALEAIGRRAAIALAQVDLDHPCFRAGSLDNVVSINFLDRRLFPEMMGWLKPGGVLLFDTFLIDQRGRGHPRNPAFLLAHNELLERIRGLRVLRYREGLVSDSSGTSYRAGAVAVRTDA
ncbi:MAG TPA: class I SAM-dependent methyltransferase [Candidatus Binatia bacterium]|nr:class I SAM-dependent methyltransferase [Candidatus Binatia bacterium]